MNLFKRLLAAGIILLYVLIAFWFFVFDFGEIPFGFWLCFIIVGIMLLVQSIVKEYY